MVIQKINQLTVNNVQSSGQMSVNQFMINNSILNEKDLDKLQKQYNYQYYQAACHGSSHDFDLFDLGAIRLTMEQGLNKIRVSPNDFNLYEIIYYKKKAELLLLLYIKVQVVRPVILLLWLLYMK